MKLKKITKILIASGLIFASLAGCESKQEHPASAGDKITVWMPLVANVASQQSNFGETALAKAVMERTGVDINFVHPPTGQEHEKFNLLVASATLPDVIEYNWLNYPGGPEKAIKEGVIIDISRHLDKANNLSSYLDENKEIKKLATTDSGELFAFPFVRSDRSLCFSSGLVIRADWLEDLNLEMPCTIEEWESVLTAFKQRKGAKAPYSSSSFELFANAFNTTTDYYLDEGRVKHGVLDPGFKDYLITMHRWYEMGLIDSNYATLDDKTLASNITTGVCGATKGSIGSGMGKWMSVANPDSDFSLEGAPIPVAQKGQRAKFGVYQLPVTSSLTAFDAISTGCRNIDAAIRYLDFGYSEEGRMLYNFGIEGESYNMVDGYPTYTELITNNPDGYSMSEALANYTRSCYTGPFVQDKRYMEQYAALPQQKRAWERWSDMDMADHALPHLYMKDDELVEYAHLDRAVNTYIADMQLKLIIGIESFDNYDRLISELREKGIDRVIEMKQAAYERYLAK